MKQQKCEGFQKIDTKGEGLGEGFDSENVRGLTKCEGFQESFFVGACTRLESTLLLTFIHTRTRAYARPYELTFCQNPSPFTKPLTFLG